MLLITTVCIFGMRLAHDGEPFWVDTAVMRWTVARRAAPLIPAVSEISKLFGPLAVGLWTVLVAAVLIARDRSIERALAVMTGVAGAAMITELAKLVVARPRPPMRDHPGIAEMTYSYPSGHVTGTAALALTTVLVTTAAAAPALRRMSIAIAVTITMVAAASRLYLGIHWVSDVLAGMAVATAAALTTPQLVRIGLDQAQQRFPGRLPAWTHPSDHRATKGAAPNAY